MGVFTKIPLEMIEGELLQEAGNVAVFSTQAIAVSSSPKDDVLGIITMGFHAEPTVQGGVAYWRYNPAATHGWCIITANNRRYELSVDIADVKIFGAKGNGTGNDSPAIQSAINYAKMRLPYQVKVWAPPGIFHVGTPLSFDFAMTFLGSGRSTELRGVDLTSSMFVADLNAAAGNQINFGEIGNFHAGLALSAGVAQTANVINVNGPGNSYFQWNYIHDILSAGYNALLNVNAESHATAFGSEGPVCWNNFERIVFANGGGGYHLYGFVFNTGSGTGNVFTNNMGFVQNYVWLYQSAGGSPRVVGDIMIQGGHWGSYNTSTSRVFAVGGGMQYRSRIRIQGMQADAGMAGILSLNSLSGTFYDVVVDVTRGGGCIMGEFPVLTASSLGFARSDIAAA